MNRSEEKDTPKLFISYSWSSEEHKDWVRHLAKRLVSDGVDVRLDQWDLKEGQDTYVFMESMVTDPLLDKVLIISDKEYVEKADSRKGGVGTEAQILTPEIYSKIDQTKFVVMTVEINDEGKPFIPTFYKPRKYILYIKDEESVENYEELLRWIYDEPIYEKPTLGSKPEFLGDSSEKKMNLQIFKGSINNSLKKGDSSWKGHFRNYCNEISENLKKFFVEVNGEEYDEKFVESISDFKTYRDNYIETLDNILIYSPLENIDDILIGFFESLIPYLDKPKGITSWNRLQFDVSKFIVHELFLYSIAILFKYSQFQIISNILSMEYYILDFFDNKLKEKVNYTFFWNYIKTLQLRNKRLKLQRISLHADLLKDRADNNRIKFSEIIQADFVIFIRNCIDSLKRQDSNSWYPVTQVYERNFGRPFKQFSFSESKRYFEKFRIVLNVKTDDELREIPDAIKNKKLHGYRDYFNMADSSEVKDLLNLEKICTQD